MPKNPEIKKVLVIGSGPIVIGQAAEFDYAGTQACRSYAEERYRSEKTGTEDHGSGRCDRRSGK